MATHDLLLEIGCEELPASALPHLAQALQDNIIIALDEAKLAHGQAHYFATPRRLAVLIPGLPEQQEAQRSERQGPSVSNAFDKDGTPTLACIGFARSCGVSADELTIQTSEKGEERVCAIVEKAGEATAELLPELINRAIKKLPLGKPMRWGNGDTRFLRPVHWVVLLLGNTVIPATILNCQTGSTTYGHRFHRPKAITIKQAKDYSATLYSQGHVIADFATRREQIKRDIQQAAGKSTAIIDENLLDEVTGLVEWPVVLKGEFDPRFLDVPPEVLITSMQTHQKCFPIKDNDNKLQPAFITVSNIESTDPATVIHGNERVIRARLSDAAFFYQNDLRHGLGERESALHQVVFQKELGTIGDKAERLSKLAGFIAESMGVDVTITERAALLAKADLVSEMVYEFPNLQGVMGYYYALNEGDSLECAVAIRDHYQPAYAGAPLPESSIACAVALADRLDTLVGILGINAIPTGDKDPFALRRAAQGILRILIEKQWPLDLTVLIEQTKALYKVQLPNDKLVEQTTDFILQRLKAWYSDQGFTAEMFSAVAACYPTVLFDFHRRILAVRQFQTLPEANALAAANKRVRNILKKIDEKIPEQPQAKFYEAGAEEQLAAQLSQQQDNISSLYEQAHYTQALTQLSNLKEPIDNFFDQVMVMVDDPDTRKNRLALLTSLRRLFTQVADISLLSNS